MMEVSNGQHLQPYLDAHLLLHIAWSAPSAIGTAGVGVGSQAGAEMTDFLVVLNSRSVSRSTDCSQFATDRIMLPRPS